MLVFEAHGDAVEQNDVPLDPSLLCQNQVVGAACYAVAGGIVTFGSETNAALPNRASANLILLVVAGTRFSGNRDSDVHGFGALSTNNSLPGTDNRVLILLSSISRHAMLSIVDSEPPDPNGTNTVVVLRPGMRRCCSEKDEKDCKKDTANQSPVIIGQRSSALFRRIEPDQRPNPDGRFFGQRGCHSLFVGVYFPAQEPSCEDMGSVKTIWRGFRFPVLHRDP